MLAFALLALGAAAARSDLPPALDTVALGDDDYVHFGQVALTSPANAGDIANLGIIVGRDAVAVIDTGGSVQVGRALLEAVRRITDKPVRYVINTHEHPDHVFGDAAFAGATFVGHHDLPRELRARWGFYLRSYRDALGQAAIAEVQMVVPTVLVQASMELDLGDRKLRLTAWAPAHTACDLTVLDERTHVLYSGDLVFLDHIPVIDDSIAGWLALMPRLTAVPAERVVPGHGRRVGAWPAALADETRYLSVVAADARRLIAAGTPLAEAVPKIGQSERMRWRLFDDYNPRNATAAYTELEWD